jgi:hypothetical protein
MTSKDRPPIFVVHRNLERIGHVLLPAARYDVERVERLKYDTMLRADFRQDRSPPHHRFYWALIGKVVTATDLFGGQAETLHKWIKLKLGMVEVLEFFDGTSVVDLTSTSWAKMDQIRFREFFDGAVQLILTDVLPGVRRRELLSEVEAMLGIREKDVWEAAA